MLRKYISIEPSENIEQVKEKIKREAGTLRLHVYDPPYKLSGNKKVLALYHDPHSWIKVDGPGFMIDELVSFFT